MKSIECLLVAGFETLKSIECLTIAGHEALKSIECLIVAGYETLKSIECLIIARHEALKSTECLIVAGYEAQQVEEDFILDFIFSLIKPVQGPSLYRNARKRRGCHEKSIRIFITITSHPGFFNCPCETEENFKI